MKTWQTRDFSFQFYVKFFPKILSHFLHCSESHVKMVTITYYHTILPVYMSYIRLKHVIIFTIIRNNQPNSHFSRSIKSIGKR